MDKILDNLLVVNLDVHIWSARKKLSPTDLNGAELPPEDLASLGSKRICDPGDIKTFSTLKSRASSLLDKHGVRFLNGWAIAEAKAQMIQDMLDNIRAEFNHAKTIFLNSYDDSVQDWIAKHPQWGSIIANSIVSKKYVSSRISFNWQMYKILPPTSGLATQLQECTDQLGYTLFEEIAKSAQDAWQRCFEGKTEITRKALSPLKAMHQKLLGLSFLEPRVNPVAELINAAISSVPQRGAIQGNMFTMLSGLVCLMQNPKALLAHGQQLLDGMKNSHDILDGFLEDQPNGVYSVGHYTSYQKKQLIESHGLW